MPPAKSSKGPVVGVDLGGTNMQIGVVSPERELLGESKRKTKSDEGLDAIVTRLISGVEEACAAAGITLRDLVALGIGAPGAVDPIEGVVLEAVNLRWDNIPIAEILSKRLGIPVFLDNDVNVAVYGEYRLGAGVGSKHLLGVWVGTGIGGGLILNNSLHYGHFMTAGEIGHTLILPGNPPGSRSLEHNCSRTAVVDRLVRLIRSNRKSILVKLAEGDIEGIKSKTIAEAFRRKDELTVEVIEETAHLLGVAISNGVTLLSLERVVLGGGLTEALGTPWVEMVKRYTRRYAFPDRCKKVEVVESQLMDHAGVFGAAMVAIDRMNAK
ncbi:MAG: ROK family protein [Phycisphaeraceae bacterium]|nr:ROK family protein [Phycisphaerae bacterium]MBX3392701.1 ROK family protein [Phycisphaeraceae bacterium]